MFHFLFSFSYFSQTEPSRTQGINKDKAESARQWTSSHSNHTQHIDLRSKNREHTALKSWQVQWSYSRSGADSSQYGPEGLQEYDDQNGSIYEEEFLEESDRNSGEREMWNDRLKYRRVCWIGKSKHERQEYNLAEKKKGGEGEGRREGTSE